METAWSQPIATDAAYRRAGGRRAYNFRRKFMAAWRRAEVARLLTCKNALFERGLQTELARELNVSRSTICRDVAYLIRLGWPCRTCGALTIPPPRETGTGTAAGVDERGRDDGLYQGGQAE